MKIKVVHFDKNEYNRRRDELIKLINEMNNMLGSNITRIDFTYTRNNIPSMFNGLTATSIILHENKKKIPKGRS